MAQDKLRKESDTKCHPERSEGSDETLHFALNTMRCRASFRVTINQRFSADRWMLIFQFAMRL
jgi:hypothetical protein